MTQAPGTRTAATAVGDTRLPVTAAAAVLFALIACALAALLGHAVALRGDLVPPIWPPSAVVLAALLLTPLRVWAASLLGALAAGVAVELQHGHAGWTPVVFVATTLLECLLAALVLRWLVRWQPGFERLRDVGVYLLVAAGLAPLGAVSAGAGAMLLAGPPSGFLDVWSPRLLGDALTHATLTPLLLVWWGRRAPAAAGIMDQISDVVIAVDHARRVIGWNRRAAAMYGWSAEEAQGRPLADLLDTPWPALRERDGVWSGTATHRTPAGDELDVEMAVSPLSGDGGAHVGEVAVIRDVTARRHAAGATQAAQRLLQSAMDALSAHIAILDERGVVIAVNGPRLVAGAGLPDPRSCVGMDYTARCEGVRGPAAPAAGRVAAAIREMLRSDRTDFRLEYGGHDSAERPWFQLRMTRFHDGGAVRVALVHENVTDLKTAEAALRELTGRLLRLHDEERRRIARELHDGTGQNLVALTMNLARLERLARADERMCGIVADSLALVEQTLHEMRTLSCVLHPPTLDGAGLASAIRWYVAGFAGRSGIEVRLDLPPDADRLPPGLESTLFRVIQESLVNVHRHSGSGTAAVRLHRGPDTVRLEVTDEGTGTAAGLRDPGDGQGSFGSGIPGLQERLRQLGGHLEIRSDSCGTTVTAVAPLLVESDAAHPAR